MKKIKAVKKGTVWKKIAIGGIIVFSIIILLAAIKTIKFKSKFGSLSDASEEQKGKALALLEEVSSEEGYLLEDYDIKIADKIIEIKIKDQKKHVLRVSLERKNEDISYLIDTNEWIVVQSTQIKHGGWMTDSPKMFARHNKMGRWFHNKLIGGKSRMG